MFFTRKRMAANAVSLVMTSVMLAAFIFATATNTLAHRVNIFAWTEGNEVVAECGFNGGNKVKQGQVVVFDAATGAKLLEGRTDDFGVYRFPISAEGKAHGVRIVIKAGEGHQNEWTVEAAELATIQPGTIAAPAPSSAPASAAASAPAVATAPAAQRPASPKTDKAPAQQAANISAADLQNIVNTALDAKLGPIRKELAELRVARPGFSEIIGGIGWLVGLAGIALYFKGRRG